jgi:hypothetical protein
MDAAHLQTALVQLEYPGPTSMTPLPTAYAFQQQECMTPAPAPAPAPLRGRRTWPAVVACSAVLALFGAAILLGLLDKPQGVAPPAASTAASSPMR